VERELEEPEIQVVKDVVILTDAVILSTLSTKIMEVLLLLI
jgi:hypothetical protein